MSTILTNSNIQSIVGSAFDQHINHCINRSLQATISSEYQSIVGSQPLTNELTDQQCCEYLVQTMERMMNQHETDKKNIKVQYEEKLTQQQTNTTNQLEKINKTLNKRQKQITSLNSQIKNLSQQLQKERKLSSSLRASVEGLEEGKKVLEKKLSNLNQELEKHIYNQMVMKQQHQEERKAFASLLEEAIIDLQIHSNNTQLKLIQMMEIQNSDSSERMNLIYQKEEHVFHLVQEISKKTIPSQQPYSLPQLQSTPEEPQKHSEILKEINSQIYHKFKEMRERQINLTSQLQQIKKRYSAFLHETQQKITTLKNQNKILSQQLQNSQTIYLKDRSVHQHQISLLEHELSAQQHQNRQLHKEIDLLNQLTQQHEQQLMEKDAQLTNKQEQVHQLKDSIVNYQLQIDTRLKQTEQLRLELVSVRDALQTLKSMKLEQETVCDDRSQSASIIMEQMVDKTYHIRLENLEYKEQIQFLHQRISNLNHQLTVGSSQYLSLLEQCGKLYQENHIKTTELEVFRRASTQKKCTGIKRNINQQNNSYSMNSTVKSTKYLQFIENLNQIINYMINYAKGYTFSGVRKECWITNQNDQEYLNEVMSPRNLQQKRQNYQRVKSICSEDRSCRELVQSYEKIMNYYIQYK